MKQGDIVSGTPGKDSCSLAPSSNTHRHFKTAEWFGKATGTFLNMEKRGASAADKYMRCEILLSLDTVFVPPTLPLHLLSS